MRMRLALFLILIFSVAPTAASVAADRFALVIGNSKYPDAEAPLKEPINDARDVADELKRDGFNVEIGENQTGEAMRRAFERLYATTCAKIYGVVLRILRRHDLAADVMEETYLQIWRSVGDAVTEEIPKKGLRLIE